MDASLRALADQYARTDAAARSTTDWQAAFPLLKIAGGKVVVDISAADAPALLAKLEGIGLEHGASFGHLVSGLLPIDALARLGSLDGLVFARASQMVTHVGATTNQADPAVQADVARNNYDVDGKGQIIGVLSDSFDNLGGYAQDKISGDLPNGIDVLLDFESGATDEGRAMLQIIHDLAPGAGLQFHTASLGLANFAQGILALADAGSTIIVDDVGYLNNPMFQDGATAQAADIVRDAGVMFFSSAGNMAAQSYESGFVNSGFVLGSGPNAHVLHDFDPSGASDPGLTFGLAPGGSIRITFQWDQPFQSVSGGSGSQNDMDIFVADAFSGTILTASAEDNIGGDPVEIIAFTNTTNDNIFLDLLIGKYSGANPGFMKFIDFRSDAVWLDSFGPGVINKSTAFGHNNAEGALSVGASAYWQTPAFGQNPPLPEDFTSLGGTPILFRTNGTRLTSAQFRQNVDFTSVDNGNTTFFIEGNDPDSDGFPNFSGTSAAAPAAAAAAALVAEATGATASQIENAFYTSALNMGAGGYDRLTGWGLIRTNTAIAQINPTQDDDIIRGGSTVVQRPGNSGLNQVNPGAAPANDVINTGVGRDLVGGGGGNDRVNGGDGNDSLYGEAGNDTLTGGAGADVLNGGAGKDLVSYATAAAGVRASLAAPGGNTGEAYADSYSGIENLEGSNFRDFLRGDNSANSIDGGKGNDSLFGEGGNDTLTGGNGNDVFNGGAGNDWADYSGGKRMGADLLNNSANSGAATGDTYTGIENFRGSDFADVLRGDNAANRLEGGEKNDVLRGRGGNDTLEGGIGFDRLQGQQGKDHFVLSKTAPDADIIEDFQAGSDKLSLDGDLFGLSAGSLNPNFFRLGNNAQDANDRLMFNETTGKLFFDPDGTGAAAKVLIATFENLPTIASTDFIVT